MTNQFLRLKYRREARGAWLLLLQPQERKTQKDCDLVWAPRLDCKEDDHPTHTCRRFKGHRANHLCGCGATKKTRIQSETGNSSK